MKKDNKKFVVIGIIAAAVIALILFLALSSGVKVSFDGDNQQPITTVKVKKGEPVDEPAVPVKEGYIFNCWQLNGEKFDFTTPIETSINLKADYIKLYKVTFFNEDKEISMRQVKEGDCIYTQASLPILEEKENYFHVGWLLEDKDFDLDQPVKSDLVLKAKWEKRIYAQAIKLKSPEMTVDLNEKAKIEYTLTPQDSTETPLFTSDNETILKVDSLGIMTPLAVGTANVTLKTQQSSAVLKVNVVVLPQSVKLEKASLMLNVGESSKISATVLPETATDKTLTYNSSDDAIIHVDNAGNIKANAAGKATITISTVNGINALCEVTAQAVEVASISLDKSSLIIARDDDATIKATISPANATNKTVGYKSSDTSIATVDANGVITAVSKGTAVITATSANGKTATCNVEVFVKVESITLLPNRTHLAYDGTKESLISVAVKPADADYDKIYWNSTGNVGGQNGSFSFTDGYPIAKVYARETSRNDRTCAVYAYTNNKDGSVTESNVVNIEAEPKLTVELYASNTTFKLEDGKYYVSCPHETDLRFVTNTAMTATFNNENYIWQDLYYDTEVWLTVGNEHSHAEGFQMYLETVGGQKVTVIITVGNKQN